MIRRWQTIKSAPKDGTKILVFGTILAAASDNPQAYLAVWSDEVWLAVDPMGYQQWALDPTHWIPLPEVPRDHP
jgi:hypothetical protein